MDLKKKFRDFFTMTRKGDGGFTLVELIVVIAILAILGGVAVPAYSGYVKKAELAADEALLKEVNTAFASACLADGQDNYNRKPQPSLTVDADKKPVLGDTDAVEAIFAEFFAGNEDASFKTMSRFKYVAALGMFQAQNGDTYTDANGVEYFGDDAYIAALLDGYFGKEFTTEQLFSELEKAVTSDLAAGRAVGMLGSDPVFKEFLTGFMSDKEYQKLSDDDKEKVATNALVLYAAKQYQNMDTDALYQDIYNGNGLSSYKKAGGDDSEFVAAYAMQYALGVAYLDANPNAGGKPAELMEAEDILNLTGTDEFRAWADTNGQSAKDSYLGAMNIVSDNTGKLTSNDLTNGFGNFQNVFNGLTGNAMKGS